MVIALAAALPTVNLVIAVVWPELARWEWARGSLGTVVAVAGGTTVIGLYLVAVLDSMAGRSPRVGPPAIWAMGVIVCLCSVTFQGAYTHIWAVVTTTALLVLPLRRAILVNAACLGAVAVIAAEMEYLGAPLFGRVTYLVAAVLWRTLVVFTLVWLVAAIRKLAAARAVLAREATLRQRAVAESELQTTVGRSLLTVLGCAREIATGPWRATEATASFNFIAETARTALSSARAMVNRYRSTAGADPQVDSAIALLEAGGWVVTTRPDVGNDMGDNETGDDFNDAVAHALSLPPGIAEINRGPGGARLRVVTTGVGS